jgi:putative transposase
MVAVSEVRERISCIRACTALGLSRATFYRLRDAVSLENTGSRSETRPPRTSPRALSAPERAQVLDLLHQPEHVDLAVPQVWARTLDQGRYLCSMRTMYRILDAAGEVRERRDQVRRPSYARPELLATGPNQVWSWDITRLKGPRKWTFFQLYVVLDIFSRYAVGWMVAEHESPQLATTLVEESYTRQGITPGQITLHSDRGNPMVSHSMALLLADLGVTKSLSRPHVSDDNPFSEAQFKTLKYRPDFPDRFGSIEHATDYCCALFDWYHHQHRHSALGWMTPADVHHGRVEALREQRASVLDAAYHLHPERFVLRPPAPPALPTTVWINRPVSADAAIAQ